MHFDETALSELASSIKIHDIIQPLTVSALASGKYKLIAGERRYRAAKIAGLKDVPAFFINGERYNGKVSYPELSKALDEALKAKKKKAPVKQRA